MHARRSLVALVTALAALAGAASPGAASTTSFRAELHDGVTCPAGIDICGKGVVHGFGVATTTLVFTSLAPGPGGTCATGTADREIVLARDGSTLLLAITGTICRNKIEGTYAVVGGTGAFAGAAGSGTVRGAAILGVPSDSVHFVGTLVLP
jgi:hypothetical protein